MRRLLAWFAKRFPEQLVISADDYKQLQVSIMQIGQLQMEMNSRLVQAEAQVKRLNDMNGYVTQAKGAFKLER